MQRKFNKNNDFMTEDRENIAIIILNYNSFEYTRTCISTIEKFTSPQLSYEIIVVDNNSDVQDYQKLSTYFENKPAVKIIRSKINLGFSGGNMFAMQYANAEYLFFLNNDTELLDDNISILYLFMKTHPEAAVASGQMFNTDMSYQRSFSYFPTLRLKWIGSSILRIFKAEKYPKRDFLYQNSLKVDIITGAAMFIDYKKFAELGGFDTTHFLYCEEEDIAKKVSNAGYSVYLVPQAKFIHHRGKSTFRNMAIEKEHYISLLYYHRKYCNYFQYKLLQLFYFIKNLKKTYKGFDNLRLAYFILKGAGLKHSLRYKQKIFIA